MVLAVLFNLVSSLVSKVTALCQLGSLPTLQAKDCQFFSLTQKRCLLPLRVEFGKYLSEPYLTFSLPFCGSQLFITVMDKLRLEIRAMDEVTFNPLHMLKFKQIIISSCHVGFNFQIQPDLRELMETMNRMSNMPPDSEAKDKVSLWFVTFCHPVQCLHCCYPRPQCYACNL